MFNIYSNLKSKQHYYYYIMEYFSNSPPSSLPPLASIDEIIDSDNDDHDSNLDITTITSANPNDFNNLIASGCYINSQTNQNKIILTNNSVPTRSRLSNMNTINTSTPEFNNQQQQSYGPIFDTSNYTTEILSKFTQQDDEPGDTGFFSSSLSYCSKRSSIEESSLFLLPLSSQTSSQLQFKKNSCQIYDDDIEDESDIIDELLASMDPISNKIEKIKNSSNPLITTPSSKSNDELQAVELSNSLEDLVNCFDEKVKSCLHNLDENVSQLAPVQVSASLEDVIKDRP